ncbi:MAG: SWIM zinc finger family protein [Alphaproteobacteria bacterium]|nr:SWIM zinc finger family protein [Alphaproteobacteria bacterium]
MIIYVDYASPSLFDSTADATNVAVATNLRRPVRFHGRVRDHGFMLRVALRALGELIWSNDMWWGEAAILDPVITVHPDRVFFEAFSQDQSVYGALIVDPKVFETMGDVVTGTTNIDFSAWLWGALGEMRTSRSTTFRIGPEGFEVKTSSAGGRFEKKVDLPGRWVRGFLQVQAAMGLPGTRVSVKPIDLLAALRMLRHTKAKVSPRGLRYEFEPGQDVKLVLEPWEHTVTFEGAAHNYTERKTTRVWGRRRLKLIEGLLPFADGVDIYLKGRALPSFYAVKLPGMTFLLGLTGWSGSGFTGTGGFDLLATGAAEDEAKLPAALDLLRKNYHVSIDQMAAALAVDKIAASRILVRLCRQGRAMFDVEARDYRHRELFETPADEATYFPPDIRQERAQAILAKGDAKVTSCVVEETRKIRNLRDPAADSKKEKIAREIVYRDWRVIGEVEGQKPVEIAVNDNGRIIFGRCTCQFFADNLMNQGPCEHMLALFRVSESDRKDQPSSLPADAAALGEPTRKQPSRWEVDSGTGDA